MMDQQTLWAPKEDAFVDSPMAKFAVTNGYDPRDYDALHRWSVSDLGGFWHALWKFTGVVGDPGEVSFVADEAKWMTGSRFFPEARINIVETLLKGDDAAIAVHFADESGYQSSVTRQELRERVAVVANGLRTLGVEPGSMVAAVLPNNVDALVAMLATLSIGGVWSACSPDFGTAAIVDRIGQVDPKVLFAAPVYQYAGKSHDISQKVVEIVDCIPSVHTAIISGASSPMTFGRDMNVVIQEEIDAGDDLYFERVPFDHPSYVLYTSGTTGKPKAIVHRAGGRDSAAPERTRPARRCSSG